jgi:hypothetical protein
LHEGAATERLSGEAGIRSEDLPTGYRPGFDWIDLDVFDESGKPIHERGVVPNQPGLYFLGLFFLHALWSETITGVQPDAQHITTRLLEHRFMTSTSR